VYLWGANDAGQLGFETEDDEQLVPRHLPFGLPVVDAAGGKSHTVIIDQAGRVYAW
jgi:alpha-tubulin suppressor-like RCC1 family protein